MRKYFKGVISKDADGWMMASCGNSNLDNQDYTIDTNSLHADQVPSACNDAKTFSQLVAGLLNCYYTNTETKGLTEQMLIEMGTIVEEEKIPSPENPTLPF